MPIEAYVSAALNKPCLTPVAARGGDYEGGGVGGSRRAVFAHPDGLGGSVDVVLVETTADSRNAAM
jgi:hypothetical protein